jgi:sugar phosphate isomerase/epimerase
MEFSLCIDSIYPKENLKEKLEKIKQAGFKFIEFWDWRDKNFELIINSGLKVTNFSGNRISSLTLDDKEKVIQEINISIDIAKKLKCDRIMLLSDILKSDGSVKINSISGEKNYFAYMTILEPLLRLLKRETLCW